MPARLSFRGPPVRWVPAVLVAGLICYWSVVTSPPPITVPLEASLTPPADSTRAAVVAIPELGWFDLRHGLAYAALALSLEYAVPDRKMSVTHTILLLFCVTITYGALMEAGQLFRPTRVASMADIASNTVGAGTALALAGLERRS
ncbi:VanZ family protein [Natrinema sp. LN54]|uniref:VanZ family protein n=1 Tax=Natrinema sp. LN54 TaxID=3458705 RepID=UPI00403520E7